MKKTEENVAFSGVEHEHWNPVASLDYERVTKSDIYVTMKINLYKPIKNASLLAKKHPFTSYPAAKLQKRGKLRVTDIAEKPVNFLMVLNGRWL